MTTTATAQQRARQVWLDAASGDLAAFEAQIAQKTDAADWPCSAAIEQNILVYDGDAAREAALAPAERRVWMAEWCAALAWGPGVIVIKRAMPDLAVIDGATEVFTRLIAEEREDGLGVGDHFAKAGANDRIWNALQKHCMAAPENFARYYAAEAVAMAAEAWLGIGYQMTAQVNRVNPGGAAQKPHRDYHLGFMAPEQMQAFPSHIHQISPVLTLQGAIAHCDMPVESGPTMLLPYSQNYFEGYLAFGRPEFQALFAERHVQAPLQKGDAVFFNPALMHSAGANVSEDIFRMVNLLQISSAFGRAMESVNRTRMASHLYPTLLAALRSGALSRKDAANAIAATAEGYAFPTNLDSDPPIGGLAPKTQAQLMAEALDAATPAEEFQAALTAHAARRQS